MVNGVFSITLILSNFLEMLVKLLSLTTIAMNGDLIKAILLHMQKQTTSMKIKISSLMKLITIINWQQC